MRVVLQRVKQASCKVDNKITGKIEKGILIFLGITHDDDESKAKFLAHKCANLRIFDDENGKMNLSLKDVKGSALIISQFTLYGDTRKGLRPSFDKAARPDFAKKLYDKFIKFMKEEGITCATGEFGAKMEIELVNDGPVTFIVESK